MKKKKEEKMLTTYSQIFHKHQWVAKALGAIDGKYILVGIADAGDFITENWKLK